MWRTLRACIFPPPVALRFGTFHVRDYASVATNSSPPGGLSSRAGQQRGPDVAESKKRKKNGHEVEDDTEIQNWTDGIPLSPAW